MHRNGESHSEFDFDERCFLHSGMILPTRHYVKEVPAAPAPNKERRFYPYAENARVLRAGSITLAQFFPLLNAAWHVVRNIDGRVYAPRYEIANGLGGEHLDDEHSTER